MLTDALLEAHVAHLKQLTGRGELVLCGPFRDGGGALQILDAPSLDAARQMVMADPFIARGYYASFELQELIEANEGNNWLVSDPQTLSSLNAS